MSQKFWTWVLEDRVTDFGEKPPSRPIKPNFWLNIAVFLFFLVGSILGATTVILWISDYI